MTWKQSKKYYDYHWKQVKGVILYSDNINIIELNKQIEYLIFEAGYNEEDQKIMDMWDIKKKELKLQKEAEAKERRLQIDVKRAKAKELKLQKEAEKKKNKGK